MVFSRKPPPPLPHQQLVLTSLICSTNLIISLVNEKIPSDIKAKLLSHAFGEAETSLFLWVHTGVSFHVIYYLCVSAREAKKLSNNQIRRDETTHHLPAVRRDRLRSKTVSGTFSSACFGR